MEAVLASAGSGMAKTVENKDKFAADSDWAKSGLTSR
jgi:hypothetical protein